MQVYRLCFTVLFSALVTHKSLPAGIQPVGVSLSAFRYQKSHRGPELRPAKAGPKLQNYRIYRISLRHEGG